MFRRLILLILAGAALLGGIVLWGATRFAAPGPLDHEAEVVIARGGVESVLRQLTEAGIVRDSSLDQWVFLIGVRLTAEGPLKAGEYAFEPGIGMRDVMELLESGRVLIRKLTLPEGLTTAEALDLLRAAEALEGESTSTPAEGELLPETYHYTRGDSISALLARMRQAMKETLAAAWAKRNSQLPLASPREALILASIVEKETGIAEERPRVAAVFLNRLRLGMRLQSDPTVAYGIAQGHPLDRPLTRADLASNTPYNTYVIDGLPPGPICNPGTAAIAAVLNPAPSEDLYFVANGTGGHAFAKTLAEHNRNVAKWRKQQGDK